MWVAWGTLLDGAQREADDDADDDDGALRASRVLLQGNRWIARQV